MRYFLHLAYQGANYRGWQRQQTAISIQATLEKITSEVLQHPTTIIGCGRTDAGVHASQYFCFFDTPKPLPEKIKFILNRRLPPDISVFDILSVTTDAHPRYDALSRTYDYFIHTAKEATLAQVSSWIDEPDLDKQAIQKALAGLVGQQDFRAYCKVPDRHPHTVCHLRAAKLATNEDGTFLRFQFTANRFLRGMIRLLVGNLIQVGKGRQSPQLFLQRLERRETPPFANYAPPQGLYLSKIEYPYLSLPNRSGLQRSLESLTVMRDD